MSDVPQPEDQQKLVEDPAIEEVLDEISGDETVDLEALHDSETDSDAEPEIEPATVSPEQLAHSLAMTLAAVKAAAENRGQDIVALDVSRQTSLFDFFIIITGSSRRQMYAIAEEIDRTLKENFNERRLNAAKRDESRWAVLDYGNIVVHLFEEEIRAFYDLESLWGDAKRVDVAEIVAKAGTSMARFE